MLTLILLTIFLGIIGGFLILTLVLLNWFKIKCPQCKQLKPLKEIIVFNWKPKTIAGQPCLKCRSIKPQVNIF